MEDFVVGILPDDNPISEIMKSGYNYGFDTGYRAGFESAQPKWISVEERLPEKSGRYLINLGNGWAEECWFDHLEERWEEEHGDYSEDVTESVTHWMPLPEPPKEEV